MSRISHRRRWRKWQVGAVILAVVYVGVGLRLWLIQDQEIFKPQPVFAKTPADLERPLDFVPVEIPIDDSAVHGYWLPRGQDAPVALFLHGQDTTLGKSVHHAQCLHELGCQVLVVDYRGFGATFGTITPSEDSVYEDAEAAWDFLTEQQGFSPRQILIYGHSLGGAIAIELAARHPEAGGLIVENSFTSVKDMVQWKLPLTQLYPLDWILRHHFSSLQTVRARRLPSTLFIHGTSDAKVPHFMSQALYEGALGPAKELLLIEGGEHAQRGAGQEVYRAQVERFIQQKLAPTRSENGPSL